tara:strand:+ start:1848 stop:2051 length:204 start_codon:yes stop_codon:yes gene_type:complete
MIITNQRGKMIVHTVSIDWDTDGDKKMFDKLPQRVILSVDDEDEIADTLSDMYGWCIFGLAYNIEKR